MFFFIFCSFGANNNNIQLQARIILHASTILSAYIILHTTHQARDDATSPTHTINGTRHPTSTVWRHSPQDGWRRGEVSRQNTRADRCCGPVSAWFSGARREAPPKRPRESRCGKTASSSSYACLWSEKLRGWRTKEEGGARSGADVLRVAVRKKRSRED